MLRPVSLLPALVVVASVAGWLGVPVTGPAAPAQAAVRTASKADDAPLAITIDNLTPSALPKKGPIHVSGSVTNVDTETWTDINLYPWSSRVPITSAAELAEAADSDAEDPVGERITEPAPYETIDKLAPGETTQYSFSVQRSRIPTAGPGVYWFGVHALGTTSEGRDTNADARARTFMPLVPKTDKTVDTALVVPIRHAVRHDPDGRVSDAADWKHALSAGRLHSLVEFGVAAGSRPITWLVDPAVPDAVRALAAGNPARSLEPTQGADQSDDQGDDSSDSPSPSDEASDGTKASSDSSDSGGGRARVARADAATTWLERLHTGLEGSEILSLPYGDVDVSGAAEHDPDVYAAARKRSGDTIEPWGLPTSPAVSSPSGYLSLAGLGLTDSDSTVIVTDRMLGERAPTVVNTEGHSLVVASSEAASGGPGPDDQLSPVAVRQRILSEAALRVLSPGQKPLVVVFPSTWAPNSTTDFFEGLDVDWLRLTDVRTVADRAGRTVPADRFDYPELQQHLELDADDFAAAAELTRSGDTLQNLLTLNDQVGGTIQDEAFSNLSYGNRLRPGLSIAASDQSRAWIDDKLRSVHIEAPKAVILSSGSGRFSATVTNDLDEPVTVKVQAVTDPPLRVSVPADGIDLAAGARSTVLLNASSSAIGIRNATVLLTDTDGAPLGTSDDLPIRSNRVSNVIWVILGAGVALLFGAIVVRLFRRVRAAAGS